MGYAGCSKDRCDICGAHTGGGDCSHHGEADYIKDQKMKEKKKIMSDLVESKLEDVLWREYDWVDEKGNSRVYKIENPVTLWSKSGGTTHRIEDSNGVVHCVPSPGSMGCVLRWKKKEGSHPCKF